MKLRMDTQAWRVALAAGAACSWIAMASAQNEGPSYEDYEVIEEDSAPAAEDAYADDFGEDAQAGDADAYTPLVDEQPAQEDLEFLAPNLGLSQPETDSPVPVDGDVKSRTAILRGLEKVTARIREIEVPVGHTVKFGRLEITVRYCRSTPPEETPETTAYLDIDDHPLDGGEKRIFSGWMFASSPALNPVQHPVYDVWVMSCKTRSPEASDSSL